MNRPLTATLCVALVAAFVACGNEAAVSGQDSTTSSDEAIRIKIHPKGGNGLFKLLAPDFDWADGGTSPFVGSFRINNTPIRPGGMLELTQNSYYLQSDAIDTGRGMTSLSQLVAVGIDAGATTSIKLGGLVVRYDSPLSLGISTLQVSTQNSSTTFPVSDEWAGNPLGARFLVAPTKAYLNAQYGSERYSVDIVGGALSEIVLPTMRINLAMDSYDPSYPNPATSCFAPASIRLYVGGSSDRTTPLRGLDGTPMRSPVVIPGGALSSLLYTFLGGGVTTEWLYTAKGDSAFAYNRLEVDDVEITQSNGSTVSTRGTWSVSQRMPNGTYSQINCVYPTHTGIDLPNGSYRVVASAPSANGTVSQTTDISFP